MGRTDEAGGGVLGLNAVMNPARGAMRAKDEVDFTAFVVGASGRLQRMAYAVCGDRPLAEDAVQAAWVKAYRNWPRVRDANSPEAYVRKMVVNQLLSWRRRRSWSTTTASGRGGEPSRASHENDVVDHDLVWSAVGSLPPRQRAVIVLRYYEGMTEVEIAEILRIRPGTVKSQSSAALTHLRELLGEADVVLPASDNPSGAR
jgi:RNA polymerase sigma-70 factor (sigma-E family)